jgi:hypothetical protein
MQELLARVAGEWPESANRPVVLLLYPDGSTANVAAFRDFTSTDVAQTKEADIPQGVGVVTGDATGKDRKITEFFATLQLKADASIVQCTRSLLDDARRHGLFIIPRAASLTLHYKQAGQQFSVGCLKDNGTCYFAYIDGQCSRADLSEQIGTDYLKRMEAILPGVQEHAQPIQELAAKKSEWFAAVDRTIGEIRAAIGSTEGN